MALTPVFRFFVRQMHEQGRLQTGGALLHIGEPAWVGPLDESELLTDANRFARPEERRAGLARQIDALSRRHDSETRIDAARLFFDIFFAPGEVQTVDFEGGAGVQAVDLNEPLTLNRQFDVVAHLGAAAHVFDVGQVFCTMHNYTAPRGLMLHECPFLGGLDRRFYNLQPTLFFDLAKANWYELAEMYIVDPVASDATRVLSRDVVYEYAKSPRVAASASLFVALRKDVVERPFVLPIQGYYSGTLSDRGKQAWRELR